MDTFQMVTDRVISELEKGTVPWHRPWIAPQGGSFNRVTGRSYSFINQLLLSKCGEYATFNQWSAIGGKVREREVPETIVFWKLLKKESKDGNKGETEKREKERIVPVLRYYRVYHISQIEGVEPLKKESLALRKNARPIEIAENLLGNYTAREQIKVIGDSTQAFYSPSLDCIHLPELAWFNQPEEYYSVAFHEMVHSTGHMKRLARPGMETAIFASENYSREELVAEIGSVALCNYLGIETKESFQNSAAYIESWLKVLRENKYMIVSAAARAEKAVAYILGTK